jgi:hypothetical protein
VEAQSFWGSLALLKSIHSSRLAFSSLHTQHGYSQPIRNVELEYKSVHTLTLAEAWPAGLRSTPMFAPVAVAVNCK